jgi:hypothetical protein
MRRELALALLAELLLMDSACWRVLLSVDVTLPSLRGDSFFEYLAPSWELAAARRIF